MSQFAQQFASTSGAALLGFNGETITYTPTGGTARSIVAIVDREMPTPQPEQPRTLGHSARITVYDRATSIDDDGYGGISAATLNKNNDEVSFELREGQAVRKFKITEVISQTGGMLTLGVR